MGETTKVLCFFQDSVGTITATVWDDRLFWSISAITPPILLNILGALHSLQGGALTPSQACRVVCELALPAPSLQLLEIF